MKISLIAAIASENRALGKDNKLIYHISDDLKRFRQITEGHVVVMGRKTYESIGRALPNRFNIVVSHSIKEKSDPKIGEAIFLTSLDEALHLAKSLEADKPDGEVFIIGGGQIYQEVIGMANKLYLTIVEGNPDADTFFPDYSQFKKVTFEENHQDGDLKYKFIDLEKS